MCSQAIKKGKYIAKAKNIKTIKMSDEWDLKILCMGAGYVGGPTMAVIAKMCPKVRIRSKEVILRVVESIAIWLLCMKDWGIKDLREREWLHLESFLLFFSTVATEKTPRLNPIFLATSVFERMMLSFHPNNTANQISNVSENDSFVCFRRFALLLGISRRSKLTHGRQMSCRFMNLDFSIA